MSEDWYRRIPGPFLRDIVGLRVECVGAYAVIIDMLFSGETLSVHDLGNLSKVLMCRRKKALSLVQQLEALQLLVIGETGQIAAPRLGRYCAPSGRSTLPLETRLRILDRDGEICRYCDATDRPFHIDHVIPVARGGTDDDENLAVACQPCNLSKGAKLLSEWRPN